MFNLLRRGINKYKDREEYIDILRATGVKICNTVIIGCNGNITKDIISNKLWTNVPNRYLKSVEQYYELYFDTFYYTENMNSMSKKNYMSKNYEV